MHQAGQRRRKAGLMLMSRLDVTFRIGKDVVAASF